MTNNSTEYDLAILGGGRSSRRAAVAVAQWGARVALIAPTWSEHDANRCLLDRLLYAVDLSSSSWSQIRNWVIDHCDYPEPSQLSPMTLRFEGIDVILETASFTQDLALQLSHRSLKASRYLLTDGYGWSSTVDSGQRSLLTHQLLNLETLPEQITVLGRGALALEWAYGLSRWATISLVMSDATCLPAADWDIQRLVQRQLSSLSIDVVGAREWAARRGLESSQGELVVVVPNPFDWQGLGLEKLGLATDQPMPVNANLKTSHSQIYVAGSSLGGESRVELTQQEMGIALANALWGRSQMMRYDRVSYSIDWLSPIARWGLTEHQAMARYGDVVQTFQGACLPHAATHAAQTNFCKLITLGNRLLGVHLMGEGAATWITALGNRPTMSMLHRHVSVRELCPNTLENAIYKAVNQWQGVRWREGQWRRDWAENWFNFRRSS